MDNRIMCNYDKKESGIMELSELIELGINDVEEGNVLDFEEAFEELKSRINARKV